MNPNENLEQQDSIMYRLNTSITTFFTTFIGIITAFIGMVIIFIVSSINFDEGSINFKETLSNGKFWIITGVTIVIALSVATINYKSTKAKEKEKPRYLAALKYLKDEKEKAKNALNYLPEFCADKVLQLRKQAERDLVEQAGIVYTKYLEYKEGNLELKFEKWQQKILAKIPKIKVMSLKSKDLLQDREGFGKTISLLPASESQVEQHFTTRTLGTRIINIIMTNLVTVLGIALGNWVTGLANALGIILAFTIAVIRAAEDTNTSLRNRVIARADLLAEFNLVKHKYYETIKTTTD